MHHLPLQVAQLDAVVVDDGDGADAGRREILQHRRREAAGAHHQHPRIEQTPLAGRADLGEREVPGVALQLFGPQGRGRNRLAGGFDIHDVNPMTVPKMAN